MKLFGTMMIAAGLFLASAAWAQSTTTKPAAPACCGEKCAKMTNCCSVDTAGKATCGMGGGCCEKGK